MSREQNIKNLKKEKKGLDVLFNNIDNFYIPDLNQKKIILDLMGINKKRFIRTFDGIILKVDKFEDINSKEDFDMIEMKSTDKKLPNFPYGSFFGLTLNEECLLRVFDNFFLCIVHTKLKKHHLFNYSEYKSMITRKRLQYQINFKKL